MVSGIRSLTFWLKPLAFLCRTSF